jgi:hypothetical protein
MKFTLLAVAMIVMVACASSPYYDDGKIKFNMDLHQDSPIGLIFSGSIDPRMETNNKIQTFLKLAGQYIPILEALQGLGNGLQYEYTYRISVMGITIDIYAYFQLYVGWQVTPGGSTPSSYEVTYTPFIHGWTKGRFNGTTWPAAAMTDTRIDYIKVNAPIGVTLYNNRRICFGGKYNYFPLSLRTEMFAALLGCEDEIIDELINQTPITLKCNYTNPVNFTLFDKNFTNAVTGNLIPETCFNY